MKRIVLILFLLLAVAAGGAYALNEYIAGAITKRFLDGAQQIAGTKGVSMSARFSRADFDGIGTVACYGLEGRARFPHGAAGSNRDSFAFGAEQVVVSVRNPFTGRATVSLHGGLIIAYDVNGEATGERVSDLDGEFEVTLNWRNRSESLRSLGQELQRLVSEGRINLPARIDAVVEFKVGRRTHQVAIRSSSDGHQTSVVLDRDDVAALAQEYTHPLTETEIDLVAENPVRAPRLLELSERAIATAISFRRERRDFPYDAFRHVYWSWLLTREFGPEFSEKVTDAHEVGATYESGTASRRMDLHNNSVGRAYALAGVPEQDIIERVYNDPNVVRELSLSTDVPSRN